MGAYDAAYQVASEANIYSLGTAFTLPLNNWGVQSLTFYNDFSAMLKTESDFDDTFQNVIGCAVAATPFYIYVDVAAGKNYLCLAFNRSCNVHGALP